MVALTFQIYSGAMMMGKAQQLNSGGRVREKIVQYTGGCFNLQFPTVQQLWDQLYEEDFPFLSHAKACIQGALYSHTYFMSLELSLLITHILKHS